MCSALTSISFPELRSPWPAVGKREPWEHPFQACAIDTIDAVCALRNKTGYAEFGYFHCYLKMDAPRALVFRPLVKGNEALWTRLLWHQWHLSISHMFTKSRSAEAQWPSPDFPKFFCPAVNPRAYTDLDRVHWVRDDGEFFVYHFSDHFSPIRFFLSLHVAKWKSLSFSVYSSRLVKALFVHVILFDRWTGIENRERAGRQRKPKDLFLGRDQLASSSLFLSRA